MNGLSLFSGIGGLDVALFGYVRTVIGCEIDPYCQAVLLSRMADESLANFPIWDDVRTLSGLPFYGSIDIIYAGFPCQDISIAGHGKGLAGERSGLFFEIVRLAKEIKPRFIFLENVPAITTRGGMQVVNEIASLGYDCRWCIISASSVGALHKRERWFLLAHSNSERCNEKQRGKSSGLYEEYPEPSNCNIKNSNTYSKSSEQANKEAESKPNEIRTWGGFARQYWPFESREHWQKTVSEMGKCSDGISFHVDRLRALGNSCVSQQAREAFEILMGLK